MSTVENSLDDLLLDINWDDPFYDLELVDIPKVDFNPKIPTDIINSEFQNFKNNFKIGHLNARSLNKNFIELKAILQNTEFDAFAVSETWLTKNTPKNRFYLDGYNIIRNDRKDSRGGGICWYLKDHYDFKIIKLPNMNNIPEMLWIEVSIKNIKMALGILYKPPKIPYSCFSSVFDNLINIYSKYQHTMLVGDFNINMLNETSCESRFLTNNLIEPFDLKQLITTPTRITEFSRTLIDLMLVGNTENILTSGSCDAPGVSDHFITYAAYKVQKVKFKPQVVTRRSFKNFDIDAFTENAELLPWENALCVSDVNSKVTILENLINESLDPFAPYKTFIIRKPGGTPWLTDEIKLKMKERDEAKDCFNETGDKAFLERFKILKNGVTSMMRKSQKNLFQETINSKIKSTRDFYQSAKKLNVMAEKSLKNNTKFSPDILNKSFLSNNNAEIDEHLVDEQITNLYKNTMPCIHKFNFEHVDEREVIKVVKSIKTMSRGIDDIGVFTLKLLINRISSIITDIINTSLDQNIYPDRWKIAIITPIPKVPIPMKPSDFRPISILVTLSKIIGRLTSRQMVRYLNEHNLLDPYQSAYKINHSTATTHLKISEDIFEAIDDCDITLLILLDFSKAFDTVNHRLLIEKLKILGFQENACSWIKSYLSDRYQAVKIGSEISSWEKIKNGVPQGSILGPLLFTILTSDMRKCFWYGSYHEYADDTQKYDTTSVENVNQCISNANEDLQRVTEYCKNNFLILNEDKCKYMFIGSAQNIKKLNESVINPVLINDKPLERVTQAKNLGMTYDEVLSWTKNINGLIAKAMGNFRNLLNFKNFLDSAEKQEFCQSMVLSQFNYCDIVYMGIDKSLENKIQHIQNICLRYIFNFRKRDHPNYDKLRAKLGWLKMSESRVSHGLIQMYKIINGHAPYYLRDFVTLTSEINEPRTRSQRAEKIWISKNFRTKIRRNSFLFSMSCKYNTIPEEITKSRTINSFKINIKKYLKKS